MKFGNTKARREGKLSEDDQEMADWDKEMREYQFVKQKIAAADPTKTPEEIAKEEAKRRN
jgi:nucleolar protein 14